MYIFHWKNHFLSIYIYRMKYLFLFEEFNSNTITVYRGINNDADYSGSAWNGAGIYFSDSEAEARLYGTVKKAKITINKPFDLTDIKDTSVQGSGLINKLCSLPDLGKVEYMNYTFDQINHIIKKLEHIIDTSKFEFSEGSNQHFKHIFLDYQGKEYVIYNRTENEYKDLNYIKSIFMKDILNEKYNLETLPISVDDAMNPSEFTKILIKNGYDSIIAPNSTLPTGNEYVVFSEDQIEWEQAFNISSNNSSTSDTSLT